MDNLKQLLMEEIGLAVNNRGNIVDQDTMQNVKFKNKNLKEDYSKGFRKNDIIFDPISNSRQMESLFRYATDKDEIDILSYGNTSNDDGSFSCVVCTNNKTIESKKYKNPSLGYIENLLTLYGNEDINLSEYDKVEEENEI